MCDCIKEVDEFLRNRNTKILVPMFGPQRPFVETTKADEKKRGKPVAMFASHCPFCGEKYPAERSAATEAVSAEPGSIDVVVATKMPVEGA